MLPAMLTCTKRGVLYDLKVKKGARFVIVESTPTFVTIMVKGTPYKISRKSKMPLREDYRVGKMLPMDNVPTFDVKGK